MAATNNVAFQGAAWALGSVYALVALWCGWKMLLFVSISRVWTAQKTIHVFSGLAAAGALAAACVAALRTSGKLLAAALLRVVVQPGRRFSSVCRITRSTSCTFK